MKRIALLFALVFLTLPSVGWGQGKETPFWNTLSQNDKLIYLGAYVVGHRQGCERAVGLLEDEPLKERMLGMCSFENTTVYSLALKTIDILDRTYAKKKYSNFILADVMLFACRYSFDGMPEQQYWKIMEMYKQYLEETGATTEDSFLYLMDKNAHDLMGQ